MRDKTLSATDEIDPKTTNCACLIGYCVISDTLLVSDLGIKSQMNKFEFQKIPYIYSYKIMKFIILIVFLIIFKNEFKKNFYLIPKPFIE